MLVSVCYINQGTPSQYYGLKSATENFCAVRDHFLNEDRGTSRAFRLAWKKPMKFYYKHTPAEAVEILKREAEEN